MKYLIAGLGNIGAEYEDTRHNIGFIALDAFAKESSAIFDSGRYAFNATVKYKGKTIILIKPTTYMNLSGKAINYWQQKENIPTENILVITDDLSLPTGKIRIRPKGSAGGHNGLQNIEETLGTNKYARLRFGIGNEFLRGYQKDYVLGKFTPEEVDIILPKLETTTKIIQSFAFAGLERTMNSFNGK